MKIAIADDELIYRKVLKEKLSLIGFTNIIFEAVNGKDLIRKMKKQRPHLVFVDIAMPEIDGLNAAEIILESYPDLVMIGYSHYRMESQIAHIRSIGFKGYLLKDGDETQLQQAIEAAMEGTFYLDRSLRPGIPEDNPVHVSADTDPSECSERETKLLELMFEDIDMVQIADRMNKAASVIYRLRGGLMKRNGIRTEAGLIRWALQKRIIHLPKAMHD